MFCKGCGKLIDSANKHCPHCGRDVDALSGGTGFWDLVVDSEEATGRIPIEQLAPARDSDPGEPTARISPPPIVADNLNGSETTNPARLESGIDAGDGGNLPPVMTRNKGESQIDSNNREHSRENADWAESAAPRNFDTQRRASPVLLVGIVAALVAIVLAVVAFVLPRCSSPADLGGSQASEPATAVSSGEPQNDGGQSPEVASDAAIGADSGTEVGNSAGVGLEDSRDGREPGSYPGLDGANVADRSADQDAPGLNNAGDFRYDVICKPQNLDGGPYQVRAIHIREGKPVAVGDDLFTISKDKTEETIKAEHAGVVSDILVEMGDNVDFGARLARIESSENRSQVPGSNDSGNDNEATSTSTTMSSEESANGTVPDSSPANPQETVEAQNQNGLGESTSYEDGGYNNGEDESENGDGAYDDGGEESGEPYGVSNEDYSSEADYQ